MRGQRLNDHERRLWVLNDYTLYRWWQSERHGPERPVRAFVRRNRAVIDAFILRKLNIYVEPRS